MSKFYEERGKYDKAETLSRLALDILEKHFGPTHPNVGLALRDLSDIYTAQGRTIEAERLRNRSNTVLSSPQ